MVKFYYREKSGNVVQYEAERFYTRKRGQETMQAGNTALKPEENREEVQIALEDFRRAQARYNKAYNAGYEQAVRDRAERVQERRRREAERRAFKLYFIKQKLMGLAIAVIGAGTVPFLDGDATAAFLLVPLGIVLVCSKKPILVNDYFYEHFDDEEY